MCVVRFGDAAGVVFRLGMRDHQRWDLGPGIKMMGAELLAERWVVAAEVIGPPRCPECSGEQSGRHGAYLRRLQDLPVQGRPVEVHLRTPRWYCRNPSCARRTFAGQSAAVMMSLGRLVRFSAPPLRSLNCRSQVWKRK